MKFISEESYREDFQSSENDNDEDDDDDNKGITKQFLASSSLCNGDIRLSSSMKKRSRYQDNHRSRSRIPQIVLIPEQTRSLSSTSKTFQFQSDYHLFNSNMYLLEKRLKHLTDKRKHTEERNEIIDEWKLMALIMDRFLFWLFASLTILSTALCLIVIPCLKNIGFLRMFTTDFTMDHKLTQMLRSVTEERIKTNANDTLV